MPERTRKARPRRTTRTARAAAAQLTRLADERERRRREAASGSGSSSRPINFNWEITPTPNRRQRNPGRTELERRIYSYIANAEPASGTATSVRGIYEHLNEGDTETEITEAEIQDALVEMQSRRAIHPDWGLGGWRIGVSSITPSPRRRPRRTSTAVSQETRRRARAAYMAGRRTAAEQEDVSSPRPPRRRPAARGARARAREMDNAIVAYIAEHQNDEYLPNVMDVTPNLANAEDVNASIARLEARNEIRFDHDRAGFFIPSQPNQQHHPSPELRTIQAAPAPNPNAEGQAVQNAGQGRRREWSIEEVIGITPAPSQAERIDNTVQNTGGLQEARGGRTTAAEIREMILQEFHRAGSYTLTLDELTTRIFEANPRLHSLEDQAPYRNTREARWRFTMRWVLRGLRTSGLVRQGADRRYNLTQEGRETATTLPRPNAPRQRARTQTITPQPAAAEAPMTRERAIDDAVVHYLSTHPEEPQSEAQIRSGGTPWDVVTHVTIPRRGENPSQAEVNAAIHRLQTTHIIERESATDGYRLVAPLSPTPTAPTQEVSPARRITSIRMAGSEESNYNYVEGDGSHGINSPLAGIITAIRERGADSIETNISDHPTASQRQRLDRVVAETGYAAIVNTTRHEFDLIRGTARAAAPPTRRNPSAPEITWIGISGIAAQDESGRFGSDSGANTTSGIIAAILDNGADRITTNISTTDNVVDIDRVQRIARATGYTATPNIRTNEFDLVRSSAAPVQQPARHPEEERVTGIYIRGELDTEPSMHYYLGGGERVNGSTQPIIEAIRRAGADIIATNVGREDRAVDQTRLQYIARETGYTARFSTVDTHWELVRTPAAGTPTIMHNRNPSATRVTELGIQGNDETGTNFASNRTRGLTNTEGIISEILDNAADTIATNLRVETITAIERGRLNRIARETGYTTTLQGTNYALVLSRARRPRLTIPLPMTFTRPVNPRQMEQLVIDNVSRLSRGEGAPTPTHINALAQYVFNREAGRMVSRDTTITSGHLRPPAELAARRAIRRLIIAGELQTDQIGRVLFTSAVARPVVPQTLEFRIVNAARTHVRMGENPEIRLPRGYKAREGLEGAAYNSLTGFSARVWTPQAGDLFYNLDRKRVYEFIRRISESQPPYALGVPMSMGVAEVKDLTSGEQGEGDYQKVMKSIPVIRIRGRLPAEEPEEAPPAPVPATEVAPAQVIAPAPTIQPAVEEESNEEDIDVVREDDEGETNEEERNETSTPEQRRSNYAQLTGSGRVLGLWKRYNRPR